jgi:hypothetical protein
LCAFLRKSAPKAIRGKTGIRVTVSLDSGDVNHAAFLCDSDCATATSQPLTGARCYLEARITEQGYGALDGGAAFRFDLIALGDAERLVEDLRSSGGC